MGANILYNRGEIAMKTENNNSSAGLEKLMVTEILARGLPHIPVSLRAYKIKPHLLTLGKVLWQEACVCIHIQDDRLTQPEREFLAAISNRLNGRRGVL